MTYSIKEASKRTGLSQHTISYYCDLNLIPTIQRDENNNRLFDEASINWLYAIKLLRLSQMSLKEIKAFFEEQDCNPSNIDDRVALLKKAIEVSDDKLQQTIKEHDQLKAPLENYLTHTDCK